MTSSSSLKQGDEPGIRRCRNRHSLCKDLVEEVYASWGCFLAASARNSTHFTQRATFFFTKSSISPSSPTQPPRCLPELTTGICRSANNSWAWPTNSGGLTTNKLLVGSAKMPCGGPSSIIFSAHTLRLLILPPPASSSAKRT
ncbi:unnamed protein product [Heterosigma akashiwo]